MINKKLIIFVLIFFIVLLCVLKIITTKVYPKVIWSYWNTDTIPNTQRSIFEKRKQVLPNYTHIIVTEQSLPKYITRKAPAGFYKLKPQAQSDWVRLALLNENGGCWMDIAIIVNSKRDFDDIYNDCINVNGDITGFYLERDIVDGDTFSFFESWFILAPKNSGFINDWLHQFEKAIDIGFVPYRNLVEKPYNCQHIYGKYGEYLTIHVTFRVALLSRIIKPKIIVYKAEDTMYKMRLQSGWDDVGAQMKKLRDEPEEAKKIPFIKLGGGETSSGIDISNYFKD